jgi:hypothetical protein
VFANSVTILLLLRHRLRSEMSATPPCSFDECPGLGLFFSIIIQPKTICQVIEFRAKYPHYLGEEVEDGPTEASI